MPRTKMTEEERQAYREAKRQEAESRMDELLTAEGFKTWLRLRRNVRSYSWANQALIALQAYQESVALGVVDTPDEIVPRIVKPAPVWKRDGYHPAKGSRAWYIWVYCSRRRQDGSWTCCGERLTERRTCPNPACGKSDHYFKLGPVFNAHAVRSFETGEPPEAPDLRGEPIAGDSLGYLLEPLAARAVAEGWVDSVDLYAESTMGEGGSWHPVKRELRVCTAREGEENSENGRLRVLIHELAHALGIHAKVGDAGDASLTYADAEVAVECVSYVVASAVGLDTSGEAIPYMVGWGGEDAREKMRRMAGLIDAAAKRIEDALLPLIETDEHAALAAA